MTEPKIDVVEIVPTIHVGSVILAFALGVIVVLAIAYVRESRLEDSKDA